MPELGRFINDSRLRIFLTLLLIWLLGIWRENSWAAAIYPTVAITLFTLLDLGLHYWKTKKYYYPFSSLVSGILIGLIIHYSQGMPLLLTAVLLAFLSKHFLKLRGRHIFNPAAFGIVVSSLIFRSPISWWSVAPGGFILILILLTNLVISKLRRLQYPLIFLAGYFLFLLFKLDLTHALSLTLDGTVFLFVFVMLPEPMTSVISGFWKYGFALAVLGVLIISILINFTLVDPLLFALLMTNFITRITSK